MLPLPWTAKVEREFSACGMRWGVLPLWALRWIYRRYGMNTRLRRIQRPVRNRAWPYPLADPITDGPIPLPGEMKLFRHPINRNGRSRSNWNDWRPARRVNARRIGWCTAFGRVRRGSTQRSLPQSAAIHTALPWGHHCQNRPVRRQIGCKV